MERRWQSLKAYIDEEGQTVRQSEKVSNERILITTCSTGLNKLFQSTYNPFTPSVEPQVNNNKYCSLKCGIVKIFGQVY